mmetsp:Transcript_65101/g.174829  ORF Transcript_65101/g.174829 Transcript_65101/m.174829 type:complete len:261 (+) Transcript_65101:696-1478(+)
MSAVERRKSSRRSWKAKSAARMRIGSMTRAQFVFHRLYCSDMFLWNRALVWPRKEVPSCLTRFCTSSTDAATATAHESFSFAASSCCGVIFRGLGIWTVTDTCWPGVASAGMAPGGTGTTWFCMPSITMMEGPREPSEGQVTSTCSSCMSNSHTSVGMSLPASSMPHLTEKATPCGDVTMSSLPSATSTSSPLCSVTRALCCDAAASSCSLAVAILRNTSSSVLMDSCTSTTPMFPRRPSSSEKKRAIPSSWPLRSRKCM